MDTVGRDAILQSIDKDAVNVHNDIKSHLLKSKLVITRVRDQVWDRMEFKGKVIRAFNSKQHNVVHNFAIRKQTDAELRKLHRMLTIRRIELREVRRASVAAGVRLRPESKSSVTAWPGQINDAITKEIEYLLNCGINLVDFSVAIKPKPGKDKKKAATKADVDDAGAGDEDESEVTIKEGANEELRHLLYHPACVHTQRQMRVQVALLTEVIRSVQKSFNKEFDSLQESKREDVERLSTKNNRIREIYSDLKINESVDSPGLKRDEIDDSVLSVTDEEVGVPRYVSEEERKRRAEEAERKRLEALSKKDDAGFRALQQMMGGTLEKKSNLEAEAAKLVREPWMDELTEEEMTKEQQEALAKFDAKVKAMEERREATRKSLNLELRKLKTEVADILKTLDSKVQKLFLLRVNTLGRLCVQELYILYLLQTMQDQASIRQQEASLEKSLSEFSSLNDKFNSEISKVH